MLEILIYLALIILSGFLIWNVFKIFYLGIKESWSLANRFKYPGIGVFISIWIFLFPIAAVVTIIFGFVVKNNKLHTSNYSHILEMGTHVNSTIDKPYKIYLYPGVSLVLPFGQWIIIKENDFEQYGSVVLNSILNGDLEYLKIHKELSPYFIWIYEKKTIPSFLQITVTDSRNKNIVTSESLKETSVTVEQYKRKTQKILDYSLKLKVDSYTGMTDEILVEECSYFRGNEIYESFAINFQHKPFGLVISSDCTKQHHERFRELVSNLANSYAPKSN